MKFECHFCKKETIYNGGHYGCLHGIMYIKHFYTNTFWVPNRMDEIEYTFYKLVWNFEYKNHLYEMQYQFSPLSLARLYRNIYKPQLVMSFQFIPDWTPENCQEKLSKVLAFA